MMRVLANGRTSAAKSPDQQHDNTERSNLRDKIIGSTSFLLETRHAGISATE
jgi:hypothetical protein